MFYSAITQAKQCIKKIKSLSHKGNLKLKSYLKFLYCTVNISDTSTFRMVKFWDSCFVQHWNRPKFFASNVS